MVTVTDARPSSVADSVLLAQRYLRTLHDSAGLLEAGQRVATAAHAMGCLTLVAASADARAVVAAATLVDQSLESRRGTDRLDKVVVVEAAAITGYHVRRAVQRARDAGAQWVGVVVLHAGGDAALASSREVDRGLFGEVDDVSVLRAN